MEVIGDKIDLRSFTRENWHQFWMNYVADPVMDPNEYIYDSDQVDIKFNRSIERESWYPDIGIFLKNGEPIGNMNLKRIDYEQSKCELGIILVNDSVKGKGYGSEAVSLLINYTFNNLGLNKIYADTMGSNIKMQKIFSKLGFRFIDRVEHCYDMNGRWEDKLNYVLERKNRNSI